MPKLSTQIVPTKKDNKYIERKKSTNAWKLKLDVPRKMKCVRGITNVVVKKKNIKKIWKEV